MQVKNTHKPLDYSDYMKILEKRVKDVFNGKKDELLWILEHKTTYTAGISSNTKDVINKKIKWYPSKKFNEGLEETLSWYSENYNFFENFSKKRFFKRLGLKI